MKLLLAIVLFASAGIFLALCLGWSYLRERFCKHEWKLICDGEFRKCHKCGRLESKQFDHFV